MNRKNSNIVLLVFLFLSMYSYSQIYNREVEAKIDTEEKEGTLFISGTGYNKSDLTQSIRYELSVIKNSEGNNSSKNSQSGRVVLESMQKKTLSTTEINYSTEDKLILLLLIYDENDNIIGKDRIAFNESGNEIEVKEDLVKEMEENHSDISSAYDGIVLKGIVLDQTKTKAGRDFYLMFYSSYLNNQINGPSTVIVNESFAMGTNTKIQIKIEEELIYEFFVRSQTDYLKSLVDVCIRRVRMYFERQIKEANLIKRY